MSESHKHFINSDFIAPNVLEIEVDISVLAEMAPVIAGLKQLGLVTGPVDIGNGVKLFSTHPTWKSDILWISQADRAGYDYFEDIFRRLRIAEKVAPKIAHDREIVMYSGFFVTRSFCNEPDFHHDWIDADNDAFTFLAPISDNCGELGLIFKNLREQQGHYTYGLGKGLVFGDYFLHSTAPGRASGSTVFLSFTFGTDRMDNWPKIAKTAAAQGMFYRQPDGQFITRTEQPSGY